MDAGEVAACLILFVNAASAANDQTNPQRSV
jgi:hypothetical protein